MRPCWEIKALGDLAVKITDGSHNPPKGVEKSEYLMLSSQNVWNGYLDKSIARHLSKQDFLVEDKRTCAREGDVLLTIVGTIGRTCVLSREDTNITFQRSVCIIKPKPELNPFFLSYQLQFKNKEINEQANGAAQKGFYLKQVERLPLFITSLPEQQRIVDILDQEFAKIDALKSNAEKSLQAAKDLFRHISNGYFAASYPVSKLGNECDFVRGPFGGSLKKSCFKASGYPVYEQQHAIYSSFSFRYFVDEKKYNEMKRFTTHPGDLIMSCSGTIGKVAIIPENAPTGIINQALLKLTTREGILPEYLKWYMQSLAFEDSLRKHSKGAAIQNVASVSVLKELSIPVPSLKQQQEIIARLDDLNDRCNSLFDNYQNTLSLCNDLKQSLLRKAFNGEMS